MEDRTRSLRICMLTKSLPSISIGGLETVVWDQCRLVAARGHDVHVITVAHPTGVREDIQDGVHVHYQPDVTRADYGRRWKRASVRAFRELDARVAFDVVHNHSAAGYFVMQRPLGRPVVSTFYGSAIDEIATAWRQLKGEARSIKPAGVFRKGAKLAWLAYIYLRYSWPLIHYSRLVLLPSAEQMRVFGRYYRTPPNRMRLVHHGIDADLFHPPEVIREVGGRAVLAAARLIENKGIQHLIRAFHDVGRLEAAATLTIIGDGPFRPALEQLALRLQISERVTFLGTVGLEELARRCRDATVFVNPTVQVNGYDLTILQAMSSGLPVVVSRIGSVPSAVTDGVDGLLVEPGDETALTSALLRLFGNPELRTTLGRNARARVLREFSSAAMAERLESVYREVANPGGTVPTR